MEASAYPISEVERVMKIQEVILRGGNDSGENGQKSHMNLNYRLRLIFSLLGSDSITLITLRKTKRGPGSIFGLRFNFLSWSWSYPLKPASFEPKHERFFLFWIEIPRSSSLRTLDSKQGLPHLIVVTDPSLVLCRFLICGEGTGKRSEKRRARSNEMYLSDCPTTRRGGSRGGSSIGSVPHVIRPIRKGTIGGLGRKKISAPFLEQEGNPLTSDGE